MLRRLLRDDNILRMAHVLADPEWARIFRGPW